MIYELAKYQSRCIDYGHAFEEQKTGVVQVLERENWWMFSDSWSLDYIDYIPSPLSILEDVFTICNKKVRGTYVNTQLWLGSTFCSPKCVQIFIYY